MPRTRLVTFSDGVLAWVGEHHLSADSQAFFGSVLLMAGVAYLILQHSIIALQGPDSRLRAAIGKDRKGKASALLYLAAIGVGFFQEWLATTIYALVALMWLVPDRRIESHLAPS